MFAFLTLSRLNDATDRNDIFHTLCQVIESRFFLARVRQKKPLRAASKLVNNYNKNNYIQHC